MDQNSTESGQKMIKNKPGQFEKQKNISVTVEAKRIKMVSKFQQKKRSKFFSLTLSDLKFSISAILNSSFIFFAFSKIEENFYIL